LRPFADLNCKIVFTKTAVTVYHPDGHPILAGWREETGPRLWHFPLTAEAAQVVLDNASPQVPIPLTAEARIRGHRYGIASITAVDHPTYPTATTMEEETDTNIRFHECTDPSVRVHECTEMCFRHWQATPTCSPTPTGHIHSSAPSRRQR
jgi:hypothetical protein